MAVTEDLPIIDIVLADINAVIPNFSSLVSSYRLLVGAAEEIHRTAGVPTEIFQRSVLRYDRAGTLIDVLLELLCCKIVFASNFLATVCAPIDLPRYFTNQSDASYTPQRTAEQILVIELLRLVLDSICEESPCFGPPPPDIGCPPVPPPCLPGVSPPPAIPHTGAVTATSDTENLLSEIAPILVNELPNIVGASTSSGTASSSSSTSSQSTSAASSRPPVSEKPPRKHYKKGARISSGYL